jgi:hypothetical protein
MILSCRVISCRVASRLASMMASLRRVVRAFVEWCECSSSGAVARRGLAVLKTVFGREKVGSREGRWEGGWVVAAIMKR